MFHGCISETIKMKFFSYYLGLLFCIHIVSAQSNTEEDRYRPIYSLSKEKVACFPFVSVPKDVCSTSIEQSFMPSVQYNGNNYSDTKVFLFTPDRPESAEPLHECGGRLPPNTRFDPDASTEIIIHGWLDGLCRTAWMREMKEQLFLRGAYNVILVDWTWGDSPDFKEAADNCQIVGQQVGFVINNIMSQTGVGPDNFHLIGHSFGAIASGYASREVNGLIGRITALGPSYAPFGDAPPNRRVTYRDAQIVDVIHGNGAECFAVALADIRQVGHADFYPNGGRIQKSCIPYTFISFLKGDVLYGLISLIPNFCSHLHIIQYYKVSINPRGCEFVGLASSSYARFKASPPIVRDRNWAVMGMDYVKYRRNVRRRKYYLDTKDFCPYMDDSYLLRGGHLPFNTSCTTLDLKIK